MKILEAMSDYSLDSVKSIGFLVQLVFSDNDDKSNLKAINSVEKFVRNAPFYLNSITLKSPWIKSRKNAELAFKTSSLKWKMDNN